MTPKLEPATYIFKRVARRFVEHFTYNTKRHLTHAQGKELVAAAMGFGGFADLAAMDVGQTAALLDSMNNEAVAIRLTALVSDRLGVALDPDKLSDIFRGLLGYAPTKPASGLFALFDRDTFCGVMMGSNSYYEHNGLHAFDLRHAGERVISRRITSCSEGIVGLDRAYFGIGGFERLLLDEAIEECLDHLGCVPFASAGYGDQNYITEQPQHLHGGWTDSHLSIAGNGETAQFVAMLGDWHRAGRLVAESLKDGEGMFVGLSDVLSQKRRAMTARFCSGTHDVYRRRDHKVMFGQGSSSKRTADRSV